VSGEARGEPAIVAIIPARMASTRLPGKMLLAETGKPLVQYAVESARRCSMIQQVVVAADDEAIVQALSPHGTRCVMTGLQHPNGSSRLAEAASLLGLSDDAIVVNVQGDEPDLPAVTLEKTIQALVNDRAASVSTAACAIRDQSEIANPNVVKVVMTVAGRAMYFSRSAIPFIRVESARPTVLRHIGLYVYRAGFLKRYVKLAATMLEQAESLEQLRILEHGELIAVARCDEAAGLSGIDTREQYEAFVRREMRTGR
jgi:3-deoxy-manno-octulosonate cytidylyltransferase (CMP-KDO synthetase)